MMEFRLRSEHADGIHCADAKLIARRLFTDTSGFAFGVSVHNDSASF
jgi:hypothetical protein